MAKKKLGIDRLFDKYSSMTLTFRLIFGLEKSAIKNFGN